MSFLIYQSGKTPRASQCTLLLRPQEYKLLGDGNSNCSWECKMGQVLQQQLIKLHVHFPLCANNPPSRNFLQGEHNMHQVIQCRIICKSKLLKILLTTQQNHLNTPSSYIYTVKYYPTIQKQVKKKKDLYVLIQDDFQDIILSEKTQSTKASIEKYLLCKKKSK